MPDRLLGFGVTPGIEVHVRSYLNGKDVLGRPRHVRELDLFGLTEAELRERWPSLYQRVVEHVKPERDHNPRAAYRQNWWVFGEPRARFRPALSGLSRYVVTPVTAKHRCFFFVDGNVLPDDALISIALDDGFFLGVLSSKLHVEWALAAGSTLEDRPRYIKSGCFDPFPFPAATDEQKQKIRDLGQALDAHRKQRQAEHPDLTITGMYNVLEKLRSGEALTAKDKVIHEKGLVSVLKKIHDDLDAAVFDAYGWPNDLTDEQTLERLVALNAERADEERRGLVRWLRPEYQMKVVKTCAPAAAEEDEAQEELPVEPRPPAATAAGREGARTGAAKTGDEGRSAAARKAWATRRSAAGSASSPAEEPSTADKPRWPENLPEQIAAVRDLVLGSKTAWTAKTVARAFKFARAASTEPVLESLAALGLLVRFEKKGERMWKATGRG